MKAKKNIFKGLSSVFSFLLAVLICLSAIGVAYEGFINEYFNVSSDDSGLDKSAVYYKTKYTEDGIPSDEGLIRLKESVDEYNIRTEEESAVLVYNNGSLPLSPEKEKNITLLGRAVVDPVYKGVGPGASIDEKRVVDVINAFTNVGFSVNTQVTKAYSASSTKRVRSTDIGEEDISFYTRNLTETFKDYGDVAIIMFSRQGSEGADLAFSDADGVPMLSLHKQEEDLLKLAKEYKDLGIFKKIILLINSAYAMDLWCVEDEEYGIDACLCIGNPGLTGFQGVANLLVGKANPSGHFVDTYATDSLSAASVRNAGDIKDSAGTSRYVVYQEGIYIGYKYYETRYEDLILKRFNANCSEGTYASKGNEWNYADEMVYPFGYGLSYTTFDQTLDAVTWNDDDTITVNVTVTNTGNVAGKSTVQVYAQTPYTEYDKEHLVEKSAIQLLDFDKTDILEPGESESVEIIADKYLIASWDSTAHGGDGGYILDDGDYYIAIGDDSHDALNNVLAAKGASGMYNEKGENVSGNAEKAERYTLAEFDDETYRVSKYSGTVVENQFDNGLYASDYNYFYNNSVTYLTRQDWTTYPKRLEGLVIDDSMSQIRNGDYYEELLPDTVPQVSDYNLEQWSDILFIDMKDVAWEDEDTWNKFLMQLSVAQLATIVSDRGGQDAIEIISKPSNYQCDGPDGSSTSYKYGDMSYNTMYVGESTASCSWNKDIFKERGEFFAEDSLYNKSSLYIAPGVNIHRTQYSGRNFEYYSEDATISYKFAAVQCKAMQENGCLAMMKHFAGNDQETNRQLLYTFMTEQPLREIVMRGFEGGFCEGGALSVMTGMNAIGCCIVARNSAILNNVIKGEWGFKGFINTDAGQGADTPAVSLVSGTDEFCSNTSIYKEFIKIVKAGDGYVLEQLLMANKRFYYAYARSNLINGLSNNATVSNEVPWWITVLNVSVAVIGVVDIVCTASYLYLELSKKRARQEEVPC